MVEQETRLPVGAHPAAYGVARLEHPHCRACRDEITGAGQARQPGTDHDSPQSAPTYDATAPPHSARSVTCISRA